MTTKRRKPKLVPKPYPLLEDVVEVGLRLGLQRTGKHSENGLTDAQIAEALDKCHDAIMTEASDRFDFGDEP